MSEVDQLLNDLASAYARKRFSQYKPDVMAAVELGDYSDFKPKRVNKEALAEVMQDLRKGAYIRCEKYDLDRPGISSPPHHVTIYPSVFKWLLAEGKLYRDNEFTSATGLPIVDWKLREMRDKDMLVLGGASKPGEIAALFDKLNSLYQTAKARGNGFPDWQGLEDIEFYETLQVFFRCSSVRLTPTAINVLHIFARAFPLINEPMEIDEAAQALIKIGKGLYEDYPLLNNPDMAVVKKMVELGGTLMLQWRFEDFLNDVKLSTEG